MSYLVISKEGIDAAVEDPLMGELARAIRPRVGELIGENGEVHYSVHRMFTGSLHIDRKSPASLPLVNVSELIDKMHKNYVHFVRPLIGEMLEALECDLLHSFERYGSPVYNLDALVRSDYYTKRLDLLDGHRHDAVNQMNFMLRKFKVPDTYRFS